MLHGFPHLYMGAVWHATSAAAPIKPVAKSMSALLLNKPVPSTLRAALIPMPAPALVSDDSNQLSMPTDITATAATAVALYRPYHAVGTCHITVLPTAVVQLPDSIPTWQAAMIAAEVSTAVAVYQFTQQPLTSWANIFRPFTNNGSTSVANLLLSKPPVESLITTETQATTMIFTVQIMTPTALASGSSMSIGMHTTSASARP